MLTIIEKQTAERQEILDIMWPVAVTCAVQLAQAASTHPADFEAAVAALLARARDTHGEGENPVASYFYMLLAGDKNTPDGVHATFAALSEAHSRGRYDEFTCKVLCNTARLGAAIQHLHKTRAEPGERRAAGTGQHATHPSKPSSFCHMGNAMRPPPPPPPPGCINESYPCLCVSFSVES